MTHARHAILLKTRHVKHARFFSEFLSTKVSTASYRTLFIFTSWYIRRYFSFGRVRYGPVDKTSERSLYVVYYLSYSKSPRAGSGTRVLWAQS